MDLGLGTYVGLGRKSFDTLVVVRQSRNHFLLAVLAAWRAIPVFSEDSPTS